MQRTTRASRTVVLTAILLLAAFAAAAAAAVAWGSVAAAQEGSGTGTVYTLTNNPERNQVVAYQRAADGTLTQTARYDTGGRGTGFFENSDSMLALGSAEGQSSPVDLGGGSELLFAANPGSDDISVFRVNGDDGTLELVDREPTGEERPSSLTVKNGVLYAMNNAGDSFPGATFCFGGNPSITGFRVADSGDLTPIEGSTRQLSGGPGSGCTQVTFTPSGDTLLVAQFGADTIDAFTVGSDGVARGPIANETIGVGPFGLNFDREGRLLTTVNGQAKVGESGVASYTVGDDGRLEPIGGVVRNGETDNCWIVDTPDGRYVYTSNFGPAPFLTAPSSARRGTISSFRLNPDGSMTLLDPRAAQMGFGTADITLTADGGFLYALNTQQGRISGYRVEDDGGLTPVNEVAGLPIGEVAGGIAALDHDAASSAGAPVTVMPDTGGIGIGGLSNAPVLLLAGAGLAGAGLLLRLLAPRSRPHQR